MRVIVTGQLRQRTFDDKEGIRRTTMEIDAEEVAASLTYATAKVTRTYRQGMPSQGGPAPTARPVADSAPTQPTPSPAPAEPHPF
jgi:single-strand DNA-binding protein